MKMELEATENLVRSGSTKRRVVVVVVVVVGESTK